MQIDLSPLMTVEQARATLWPFRELKGQSIGSLLDKGMITLKDLGFAVERAYDKRVRDAAKTLILHSLQQKQYEPAPAVGPLNVLSSDRRSFAERRQIQLALLNGLISGLVMGALCLSFIQTAFFRGEPNPESRQVLATFMQTPRGVFIVVLATFIVFGLPFLAVWFTNWISNRIFDQMSLYRIGQQGEERVLNALYHSLDGNWWLFRNLEIPGQRNGDIDLVLVGITGVWVLEIKAYRGAYRTVGTRWERRVGKNWLPSFTNPSKQAKRNAATLSHVLSTHNIKQWVTPIVIWANPDGNLTVENPDVFIWHLFQVADELEKLQGGRAMLEEQRIQIVEIMKGFYRQPFISENG